jgi:hypothetical protein
VTLIIGIAGLVIVLAALAWFAVPVEDAIGFLFLASFPALAILGYLHGKGLI